MAVGQKSKHFRWPALSRFNNHEENGQSAFGRSAAYFPANKIISFYPEFSLVCPFQIVDLTSSPKTSKARCSFARRL